MVLNVTTDTRPEELEGLVAYLDFQFYGVEERRNAKGVLTH